MSVSLDSPRDIDGYAGPGATAVTYGELHVDHAVIQEQRLPFASEGESLVRVAGQSTFQGQREIGVREPQCEVDVFGGARPIA
jgi:hypothetical protein